MSREFSRASWLSFVSLTGIYHWSLRWGCLAPGQCPWSCWRCGIGSPGQPRTGACSGGCWRLGIAGTSLAHIPPVPLCSVPVNQQQEPFSACEHCSGKNPSILSHPSFYPQRVHGKKLRKWYLYPVFHISIFNDLQDLVFLYGQFIWLRSLKCRTERMEKWL